MSVRAITPRAVIEAVNVVNQLVLTHEFPSTAYCVGYAVSQVFRASPKSRSQKVLNHRSSAKSAVWRYLRNGELPPEPVRKKRTQYKLEKSPSIHEDYPPLDPHIDLDWGGTDMQSLTDAVPDD